MIYKIIVDKQNRNNPSSDKKEYEIDIEELRCKGEVHDSLIITKDEDYVIRRLELTKYYVLKELSEPIKEPLPNVNIELFEGENYIYLLDMTGNKLYAEYLVKNEFNDIYVTQAKFDSGISQTAKEIEISVNKKLAGYSTTEEMNASINATAEEVEIEVKKKVGKDEVVASINASAEKVQIDANKVSLKGKKIDLTSDNITIDSTNFKVDEDGNVTCNNANLKGNIFLPSGGQVIGGQGILTNIQAVSVGRYKNYDWLGFNMTIGESGTEEFEYSDIPLDVNIPNNFTIVSAYVTVLHKNATWNVVENATTLNKNGYSRNVKLYKAKSASVNYTFTMTYLSDYYYASLDSTYLTEIPNAFATYPYTPSAYGQSSVTSINIKSYLEKGDNKLILRSSNAKPTTASTSAENTGMAKAYINIIGYMSN